MEPKDKGRLEALEAFVAEQPDAPLPLYGLAMEHRRLGDLEAASRVFAEVRARFPDYVPAYLIHGQVLEGLGDTEAARAAYAEGIERARAAGEAHAASELEAALDAL